MIGLILTVWLARHGVGLARGEEASAEDADAAPAARAVVKALFPLWATVLVLLATRIPQLGLRGLLTAATPHWDLPLGSLGDFSISPALVVSLHGIFGTETDWTHQILYVPSFIPFVLVSIVSWRLFAAPAGTARKVWGETAGRMRNPILALLGELVFVRLMMVAKTGRP